MSTEAVGSTHSKLKLLTPYPRQSTDRLIFIAKGEIEERFLRFH